MESTRAMTRERGSPAESKNCEILLLPTSDRRFDTKVKCPTGRASFWVKFPTVQSLTRVKCPGIAQGVGGGWAVLELTVTLWWPIHIINQVDKTRFYSDIGLVHPMA